MDGSSSDHSRVTSENTNGSWNWDTEDVSISRFNLGDPDELQDLVEDKEIAARAVAFVVNGTRRGIVPLCADVASLIRSKRRLEKRFICLKREVEVLRRVSQHASPTPTSVHSYSSSRGSFMDAAHVQVFNELLRGAQCNDGTPYSCDSSQLDGSPVPQRRCDGLHRTTAYVPIRNELVPATNCNSNHDIRLNNQAEMCERRGETEIPMSCIQSVACMNNINISHSAVVHSDSGVENSSLSSRVIDFSSLPDEMDGLVGVGVSLSVSQDEAVSLGVGCCCRTGASGRSLEDRFNKSMKANMRLADELASTRRQMELLTTRLHDFELRELSCCESFNEKHSRRMLTSVDTETGALPSVSLSCNVSTQDVEAGLQFADSKKSHDMVIDSDASTVFNLSCSLPSKVTSDVRSHRSVTRPLHRSKALKKGNPDIIQNDCFLSAKTQVCD